MKLATHNSQLTTRRETGIWHLAALLLAIALLLVAGGCADGSAQSARLFAAQKLWGAMGPEYRDYVAADGQLDDESKAIRGRTADLMDEATQQVTSGKD